MKTGDYLRNLREQKDLSMRQVMIRSQGLLDKTTISRIEKNERSLSLRAAYAFSKIYQSKLSDLAEIELGVKIPDGDPPMTVSAMEKDLLRQFRRLGRARKTMAMEVVLGLAQLGGRPAALPRGDSQESDKKPPKKSAGARADTKQMQTEASGSVSRNPRLSEKAETDEIMLILAGLEERDRRLEEGRGRPLMT
jgi:transcriptional regulator with XRE-family HTH domain